MSFLWVFLSIAGLLTILVGFIEGADVGCVCIAGVVIVWIIVAKTQSHFRGLARRARKHLGFFWTDGESVVHMIPERERLNIYHALESLRRASTPTHRVLGMGPNAWDAYMDEESERAVHFGLSLAIALKNNPKSESLRYARVEGPDGTRVRIPSNGFYRLTVRLGGEDVRAIVAVSSHRLEVLALDGDKAQDILDLLLSEASRLSVYRGRILSLERSDDRNADDYQVRFHDLPTASRDEIILPPDVLKLIERNLVSVFRHAGGLQQAGFGARHGVLFYGPPGTGKSLVVRHICRSIPELTVILLTGKQQQLIRESCRIARLLAPCLVVLEDVDLIATDRQQSRDTTLLHDLMDEMDGLSPKSEVVFLLTTNRPEVLEKALTARPGRIDQAILFPLPDSETRERLLRHFGRNVGLLDADVSQIVERTDGASPAFLQELVRRATLLALEDRRSADSTDEGGNEAVQLNSEDFRAALHELVELGGPLTQQLLGFSPNRASDDAPFRESGDRTE
jgi:hypothetical protein